MDIRKRAEANLFFLNRTGAGDCERRRVRGFLATFEPDMKEERVRKVLKATECDCGRCRTT